MILRDDPVQLRSNFASTRTRDRWTRPGMKRAIATALVCALWACASEPEPPQHVVLITLDTTRADHLGAYGSTVSTPHLDALAAESVVFEQAAAACTTTLPSHVSLMSGRWPLFHGVARNGYVVSRENVMLAEILAGAGFRSIGVSAALELSDLVDFSQGFDVWDQDPESYAGHVVANRDARRAEEITDAAISLLDEAGDERLFLFVHYVDPHAPYDPPEPFRSAHGDVPEGLVGDFAEVRRAKRLHRGTALEPPNPRGGLPNLLDETVTGRTRRRAVGNDALLARLYAGEVSYMDHHLGRLLRELRERGLSEDALVIVTADHGETFWEHEDLWSHGLAVYDTNARIPLIVRFPGGRQ
jgi:arylsulfatase A-like enzyme